MSSNSSGNTASSSSEPSSAAAGVPLNFSEDTNAPRDVCNAQWHLLWTVAAYTNERLSPSEQEDVRTFFGEFPDQCRSGPAANCYQEAVKKMPPGKFGTRREVMSWLCMIENECRKKAGMPQKMP
eukprot:Cvel_10048.t1-p1 / transcript=Cvel_10048.t1 / gene=Cvel_10048 / organism=Chromera_velia_CCMP2878 / gene_product=hypothetical protein / transcript_product=hypothetical protein / location=Cvel_scaffold597:77273-77815(+) / protein_length=124 / sequence_SO=supercontig / SO=protein_coding / is_pseudo=false